MGPVSPFLGVERNGVVANSNSPEWSVNGMGVPLPQHCIKHGATLDLKYVSMYQPPLKGLGLLRLSYTFAFESADLMRSACP